MRQLLPIAWVALVGSLAAALVASLGTADVNVALAAGIGVCVLAPVILEARASSACLETTQGEGCGPRCTPSQPCH
jgi:hypothetical protein